MSDDPTAPRASRDLATVLESASRLQELVPDAVLVGGSAAALYAGHRDSFDHDHVLTDLRDRFEMVLDARWHDWRAVRAACGEVATAMLGPEV